MDLRYACCLSEPLSVFSFGESHLIEKEEMNSNHLNNYHQLLLQQPSHHFSEAVDPISCDYEPHTVIPDYQYSPQARQVLGTHPGDKTLHPWDIRRCFNCGDPSHSLLACQQERNEPLIRLSKQIFQARNALDGGIEDYSDAEQGHFEDLNHRNYSRLKDVVVGSEAIQEDIARRRLLAFSFAPGRLSASLRQALFWEPHRETPDQNYLDPYRPMPWFQAMEKWGYPPAYVIPLDAHQSPFQRIIERIENSNKDHDWESAEILQMHRGRSPGIDSNSSDEKEEEEEILRLLVPDYDALKKQSTPLPPERSPHNTPLPGPSLFPPLPNSPSPPPPPPPPMSTIPTKRLVEYKGGNFSSDRLPVYNGQIISTQSYLDYYSGHHRSFSSSKPDSILLGKRKIPPWRYIDYPHPHPAQQQPQQYLYQEERTSLQQPTSAARSSKRFYVDKDLPPSDSYDTSSAHMLWYKFFKLELSESEVEGRNEVVWISAVKD
ncbi:uncharacterized protein VP01_555g1 [Puccinia sorghi]|uniref:PSP proline-rich domain-containing protein n=1 Tax=Puccinia sorghi TaxID=27349 RepID=A0A0L6UJ79_9BASI|nr:uncharacterized protein VP01_555g1 [Puccinia sorghi]